MLIFDRRAQGAAKPLRVISGPRTMLDEIKEIRTYRDWIVVVNDINTRTPSEAASFVAVWNMRDEGDAPPRWIMDLGKMDGVPFDTKSFDLDPKNKAIVIATGRVPNNAVLTYAFPELFEAGAETVRPRITAAVEK
jgi:hypothetical protein